jgi:hypothetical protein
VKLVMFLRVDPLVLLQILRPLERLAAHGAWVGLERGVDSEMTRDVISLDAFRAAPFPAASEVQVARALPPDMLVAEMLIQLLGSRRDVIASCPLALDHVLPAEVVARRQ